jgi:hypothetical protein
MRDADNVGTPNVEITNTHLQEHVGTNEAMLPDQAVPQLPFLPDHGPTIFESQSQPDISDFFTFDIADLPYVPNSLQPPPNNAIYGCYPYNELEALIGTTSPQSFGNNMDDFGQSVPVSSMHDIPAVSVPWRVPAANSGAIQMDCQTQSGAEAPTWQTEIPTPSSTGFVPGARTIDGRTPNAQKEVLVATAAWLNQIVSIMQ